MSHVKFLSVGSETDQEIARMEDDLMWKIQRTCLQQEDSLETVERLLDVLENLKYADYLSSKVSWEVISALAEQLEIAVTDYVNERAVRREELALQKAQQNELKDAAAVLKNE